MDSNLLDKLVEPDGTELLVLLVDDDVVDAERVARLIGTKVKLHTARSTVEALHLTKNFFYRCILLDLNLPDRNGLDVIPVLKESAPIIVLTGTGSEASAVEAMRRGAEDYVPKERASADVLCLAIAAAIKRRRLESTVEDQRAKIARDEQVRARMKLASATHDELSGPLTRLTLELERLEKCTELSEAGRKQIESCRAALSQVTEVKSRVHEILDSTSVEAAAKPLPGVNEVLVVEDVPENFSEISDWLALESGWKVRRAETIKEAMTWCAMTSCALVMCSHRLTDGEGADLVTALRHRELDIPVIVYTEWPDEPLATRLLRAGADACLCKSTVTPAGLLERARACVEAASTRRALRASRERRQRDAYIDSETGLYNDRFLVESIAARLSPVLTRNMASALLLVSVEAQPAGRGATRPPDWDELVVLVARSLRDITRKCELLARHDDTTLAVLIPGVDTAAAKERAEQYAAALEDDGELLSAFAGRTDIRVGVATFSSSGTHEVQEVLTAARSAMAMSRDVDAVSVKVAEVG